jgi:hypothetical protein
MAGYFRSTNRKDMLQILFDGVIDVRFLSLLIIAAAGKGLGEKEQGQFEPIAAKETTSLTEGGSEEESADIYDAYRKRFVWSLFSFH